MPGQIIVFCMYDGACKCRVEGNCEFGGECKHRNNFALNLFTPTKEHKDHGNTHSMEPNDGHKGLPH